MPNDSLSREAERMENPLVLAPLQSAHPLALKSFEEFNFHFSLRSMNKQIRELRLLGAALRLGLEPIP